MEFPRHSELGCKLWKRPFTEDVDTLAGLVANALPGQPLASIVGLKAGLLLAGQTYCGNNINVTLAQAITEAIDSTQGYEDDLIAGMASSQLLDSLAPVLIVLTQGYPAVQEQALAGYQSALHRRSSGLMVIHTEIIISSGQPPSRWRQLLDWFLEQIGWYDL